MLPKVYGRVIRHMRSLNCILDLGKIARTSQKASPSSNAVAQSRLNRRNNAKQTQLFKRNALVSATRVFNGVDGAPRIVAVIPLTPDVSQKRAVSSLAETLDISAGDCPEDGLWKMRYVKLSNHLFSYPSTKTYQPEPIVSRRLFNSEPYHTTTFMMLWMRAKSRIMFSLSFPVRLKSTLGATPSCARCKRRDCQMLSVWSPQMSTWTRNRARVSSNRCFPSFNISSRVKRVFLICIQARTD